MAAKTNFTIKDFEEILADYTLGGFVYAKPISNGSVQTNFLLMTTRSKLVFRYYENRSQESVSFEINLINYLLEKKYPCPTPYINKYGQYMGIYKEKPYVIFQFVEGVHVENPNEDQKNQLVEKVAELHNITRGYRPKIKKYRLNYDIETCKKLAQEKAEKINTENAREKLKWYTKELEQLIFPKTLPKGVCHSDFHFSNVLYNNGVFNALLDFDDANYTFLIFDLVCLMEPFKASFEWDTWDKFSIHDNVFDFRNARKVIQQYSKYRTLNLAEKTHLFDVLKLSVLIDCIWYFERGDISDFFEKRKIDYLNALGKDKFYRELFE